MSFTKGGHHFSQPFKTFGKAIVLLVMTTIILKSRPIR